MTPERLHDLLDRFGADPRRWPEGERAAARALLEGDADALRAATALREVEALRTAHADAAWLDRELDAHRVASPDAALIARIAATAPAATTARRAGAGWRMAPIWPRAGWALTGLAGAFAGAVVVGVALGDGYPTPAADWQKRGTAFSDRAADWSEE